ncbi:MAG TPA: hypothetical protein VK915_07185 [Gaiellaceae bacterium]|nr:hypothetical protein [Gaiellaceae bacterium]
MDWKTIGNAGATPGWRGRLADTAGRKASQSRFPLSGDQARALVGVAFLALTVVYLGQVGRRLSRA